MSQLCKAMCTLKMCDAECAARVAAADPAFAVPQWRLLSPKLITSQENRSLAPTKKRRFVLSLQPTCGAAANVMPFLRPEATVWKGSFLNMHNRDSLRDHAFCASRRALHSVATCVATCVHVGEDNGRRGAFDGQQKKTPCAVVHPGSLSVCPSNVAQGKMDCACGRSVTVRLMLCPAYQRGKRHRQGLRPRMRATGICLLHYALIINTPDSSLAIRPRMPAEGG